MFQVLRPITRGLHDSIGISSLLPAACNVMIRAKPELLRAGHL